jgi:hypothetical protein
LDRPFQARLVDGDEQVAVRGHHLQASPCFALNPIKGLKARHFGLEEKGLLF